MRAGDRIVQLDRRTRELRDESGVRQVFHERASMLAAARAGVMS